MRIDHDCSFNMQSNAIEWSRKSTPNEYSLCIRWDDEVVTQYLNFVQKMMLDLGAISFRSIQKYIYAVHVYCIHIYSFWRLCLRIVINKKINNHEMLVLIRNLIIPYNYNLCVTIYTAILIYQMILYFQLLWIPTNQRHFLRHIHFSIIGKIHLTSTVYLVHIGSPAI